MASIRPGSHELFVNARSVNEIYPVNNVRAVIWRATNVRQVRRLAESEGRS